MEKLRGKNNMAKSSKILRGLRKFKDIRPKPKPKPKPKPTNKQSTSIKKSRKEELEEYEKKYLKRSGTTVRKSKPVTAAKETSDYTEVEKPKLALCVRCGAVNSKEEKFCTNCGSKR